MGRVSGQGAVLVRERARKKKVTRTFSEEASKVFKQHRNRYNAPYILQALKPEAKTELQQASERDRAAKAFHKWVEKYKESAKNASAKKPANPPMGFIYLGLGIAAIGLIVSFVGLGDRSFRTDELRLIGPLMTAIGFSIIFIRSVLCCVLHWSTTKHEQQKVAPIPEVVVQQPTQPQSYKFKPRLRKISSEEELDHFSIPMSNESLMYQGLNRVEGEPVSLDYESIMKRKEVLLDPVRISNKSNIMVPNGVPTTP